MSPEDDQYMQLMMTRAYYKGMREGVEMYAHWREGDQYVGTTGRTLKNALEALDIAESETLKKYSMDVPFYNKVE